MADVTSSDKLPGGQVSPDEVHVHTEPEPAGRPPTGSRSLSWVKSHKALTAAIVVLACAAVAAIILIPIAVTGTGALGRKERKTRWSCPPGSKNSWECVEAGSPMALVVAFRNGEIDAMDRVPASLRPYVERVLLSSSLIQILRFEDMDVLWEIYRTLKLDKDVEFLLRDRKMRVPTGAVPSPSNLTERTNLTSGSTRRLLQSSGTSDPYWSYQDYLHSAVAYSSQIQGAWETTTGHPGIVVAVVDTGVDYTHPDLKDIIWTNKGEVAGNNVDDDKNGFVDDIRGWNFGCSNNDVQDTQGHGTNVAGIIAAVSNNNQYFAGAAHVQLMPLRLTDCAGGNFWLSTVLDAFNYAALMGAHLVSASVGPTGFEYGVPTYPPGPDQASLNSAFDQANLGLRNKGALIVAAAGNDAISLDTLAAAGWAYPPCITNATNVLCIGATDTSSGARASFSNYGSKWVTLYAPGSNICNTQPMWQEKDGSGGYCWSGTSQATPVVTGTAALVLSVLMPRNMGNTSSLWPAVKSAITTAVVPGTGLPSVTGGRVNAVQALATAVRSMYGTPLQALPLSPNVVSSGLAEAFYRNPLRQFDNVTGLDLIDASTRASAFPVTSFKYSGAGILVQYAAMLQLHRPGPSTLKVRWPTNGRISIWVGGRRLGLQSIAAGGNYNASFAVSKAGWYQFQVLIAEPTPTSRLEISWLQPGMTDFSTTLPIYFTLSTAPPPTPYTPPTAPIQGFTIAYSVPTNTTAAALSDLIDLPVPSSQFFSHVVTVPDMAYTATGPGAGSLQAALFPGVTTTTAVFGTASTMVTFPAGLGYIFQATCALCKLYLGGLLILDAYEGLPKASGCVSLPTSTPALGPLQLDFASPSLSISSTAPLLLRWQPCTPNTSAPVANTTRASLAPATRNPNALSPQSTAAGTLNGLQCNFYVSATLPDPSAPDAPTWQLRLPKCPDNTTTCTVPFQYNIGTDLLPSLSPAVPLSARCWAYWSTPPPATLNLSPPGNLTYAGRPQPTTPTNPTAYPPLLLLEWYNLTTTSTLTLTTPSNTPITLNSSTLTLPLPRAATPSLRGIYSIAYTPNITSPHYPNLIPSTLSSFPQLSTGPIPPFAGLNTTIIYPSTIATNPRYAQTRGFIFIPTTCTYRLLITEPVNQGNHILIGGVTLDNPPVYSTRLSTANAVTASYHYTMYLPAGYYPLTFITRVTNSTNHLYNVTLIAPSPALGPVGANLYFQDRTGY